ncbi:hypothetical protein OVA24_08010 [Luteolibacter sp. SL250]|uniref:hypothetical protein n=1 Tax=Luteolibacter sp. SL250 TaxID=2995170 RepID=UPI002270BAEF|nr:hypothetical protein [Luteolibacter sp. SL250]WAC21328.1 hypothetical protein OVA24_08010 [Luteolibacter sp. SL250]
MDGFEGIFQYIAIAGLVLGLLVKPWDVSRVRTAIRRKGGKVTKLETGPYSSGWLVGMNSTIHQVEYTDDDGETHLAEVSTSLLMGLSFVSDIIMPKARLLRKNPKNPEAAAAARKASGHHYPEFPSDLKVDESRRPRQRMACRPQRDG